MHIARAEMERLMIDAWDVPVVEQAVVDIDLQQRVVRTGEDGVPQPRPHPRLFGPGHGRGTGRWARSRTSWRCSPPGPTTTSSRPTTRPSPPRRRREAASRNTMRDIAASSPRRPPPVGVRVTPPSSPASTAAFGPGRSRCSGHGGSATASSHATAQSMRPSSDESPRDARLPCPRAASPSDQRRHSLRPPAHAQRLCAPGQARRRPGLHSTLGCVRLLGPGVLGRHRLCREPGHPCGQHALACGVERGKAAVPTVTGARPWSIAPGVPSSFGTAARC